MVFVGLSSARHGTHAKPFKRLTLERGETPRIAFDTAQVLDDPEAQRWAMIGAAVLTS